MEHSLLATARRNNQRTFQELPEQKMAAEHDEVPLNAIRVFVTIAREGSVTRAASTLGTTQSSVSRYWLCYKTTLARILYKGEADGAN